MYDIAALADSVITSPNGTLIATVIRYANEKWEKQRAPVYFLSDDHGHTWKGPRQFDKSAAVDDIAYTMDTSFVRDGEVLATVKLPTNARLTDVISEPPPETTRSTRVCVQRESMLSPQNQIDDHTILF